MANTIMLMPEQAAMETGVAKQTLADWRHQQKGPPFVRIGRSIRYRKAALEQWAQDCEIDPAEILANAPPPPAGSRRRYRLRPARDSNAPLEQGFFMGCAGPATAGRSQNELTSS
ncbi:MAG: helix-turn-helix domain-containing protein [Pseudomonadota bacterium]